MCTLTDRDILAIIKVTMDKDKIFSDIMRDNLFIDAQFLQLTEQEEHDACVHAANAYRYGRGQVSYD
jgi:hypothetical protein